MKISKWSKRIIGCLFLVSLGMSVRIGLEYHRIDRDNEQIRLSATRGEEELTFSGKDLPGEEKVTLPVVDFTELKKKNQDVIGWIYACNGRISYPVVASEEEYYLSHSLEGKESKAGTIFADATTLNALEKDRLIVYGHNMKNGSMFHPLIQYARDPDYQTQAPYIYLLTPDTIRVYRIERIRVLEYEDILFADEKSDEQSRKITLITCEYSGTDTRLVVDAVEDKVVQVASALSHYGDSFLCNGFFL